MPQSTLQPSVALSTSASSLPPRTPHRSEGWTLRARFTLAIVIAALSLTGRTLDAAPVTFTQDIAPILFEHCAVCHHPEGPAPFSLLTYDEASARAQRIALVTRSRSMPPWKPEPGYGAFVGVRRLSDAEIDLIRQWVDQGALEGDASDLPPRPSWPDGWILGQPDLVVRLPEPYLVAPDGPDVYRNFSIPIPVTGTRYVRGVELRPGSASVHHARIMLDRAGRARARQSEDPEPGYDGLLPDGAEFPPGHFLGWAAGKMPALAPFELAWRMDPGTDVVLQTHLLPTGRPERLHAEIGFFFSDTPPTREPVALVLSSKTIDIPPGDDEYLVTDHYTLPVDVEVLRVYPHAHYLGRDLKAFATRPDDTIAELVHIADWDFKWQDDYQYAQPIHLPKGSMLTMQYVYDNSSGNTRNPRQPPERVVFGPRSSDEMAELLLQVVPRNDADLAVLRRDMARKGVEVDVALYEKAIADDPGDHESHDALAVRYHRLGRTEDAIEHFDEALRLEPDFVVAHYNYGTVLAANGRLEDAVGHLRRVVAIEPDHAAASNNLGGVLQSLGRVEEALGHYRRAAELAPDDAGARHNVGIALEAMGRRDEAITAYRHALRLGPDDPETLTSLGGALSARGELDEAIGHFSRVLEVEPDSPEAHYNLAGVFVMRRRPTDALTHYRHALRGRPDWPSPLAALAWILSTDPDPGVRDARQAVSLAERAVELTNRRDVQALDALAAAYANDGRFAQAVRAAGAAFELARAGGQEALATAIRRRLQGYEQRSPHRQAF